MLLSILQRAGLLCGKGWLTIEKSLSEMETRIHEFRFPKGSEGPAWGPSSL